MRFVSTACLVLAVSCGPFSARGAGAAPLDGVAAYLSGDLDNALDSWSSVRDEISRRLLPYGLVVAGKKSLAVNDAPRGSAFLQDAAALFPSRRDIRMLALLADMDSRFPYESSAVGPDQIDPRAERNSMFDIIFPLDRDGSAQASAGADAGGFLWHTVAYGETMSTIAVKYFNAVNAWGRIWKANPAIDNPHRLFAGMRLRIPRPRAGVPAAPARIAPALAAALAQANDLARRIHFDTDRTEIRAVDLSVLDDIAKILRADPSVRLRVEGHTDSRGDPGANQVLSEGRANNVREYLVKKGLDGSRISAVGFGGNRPLVDNDTYRNRLLNRRVEFCLDEAVPETAAEISMGAAPFSRTPEQAYAKANELARSIRFETGSTGIRPEDYPVLDGIAVLLKDLSGGSVIEGHTDDRGDAQANLALSQGRATSVREYLMGKGLDGSRLIARGWGGGRPLVSNDTLENRIQNRRVEFSPADDAHSYEVSPASPAVAHLSPEGILEAVNERARSIGFDTDSFALRSQDHAVLDEIASLLRGLPLRLCIEGHTDSRGNATANQLLSRARAESVRAYVIRKGARASLLRAVGRGGTRPLVSNDTLENRIKNRRIEFVEE